MTKAPTIILKIFFPFSPHLNFSPFISSCLTKQSQSKLPLFLLWVMVWEWFPFQWFPWTDTVPKGSISIYPALQQVQISCGTEGNEGLKGLLVHLVQHHRMWWVALPHPGGTREINYCETVCILQVFSPVMTPWTAQVVGTSLDRGVLQCLKSWKYFPNTRTTLMPSLH